jgi:hypothetical protein
MIRFAGHQEAKCRFVTREIYVNLGTGKRVVDCVQYKSSTDFPVCSTESNDAVRVNRHGGINQDRQCLFTMLRSFNIAFCS